MSNPKGLSRRGIKKAVPPAPTNMKTYKLKRREGTKTSDRLLEAITTRFNRIINDPYHKDYYPDKAGFGKSEYIDEWFDWSESGNQDLWSMANHLFTVEVPKLKQIGWVAHYKNEVKDDEAILLINKELKNAWEWKFSDGAEQTIVSQAFDWISTRKGYGYWELVNRLVTLEPLMEEDPCA